MKQQEEQEYERILREQELQNQQLQTENQQKSVSYEDAEKTIVSEQLDVGEILDRIHYLLRGYTLQIVDGKGTTWVKPTTNDMIILTEYGVNYIMGAIQWYLNKNTLLSNYDDKQISAKMEDFAISVTDAVFMEYDKMFLYPSLDDCKDEIEARIKKKIDLKLFAAKLTDIKLDESEVRKEILKEMEGRIEHELETIKQQKIKNKLKRFESLMRFLQDTVHSAYQRAWKGQERTTLRQHTHISETRGSGFDISRQRPSLNPFKRQ